MFSLSTSFTLRVLTPPLISHPETEMHRSLHPIFLLCFGFGSPVQTSFHPAGLHCPSCTLSCRPQPAPQVAVGLYIPVPRARFCLLAPRPDAPFSALNVASAPVNSFGFSILGYLPSTPVLKPPTSPLWPQLPAWSLLVMRIESLLFQQLFFSLLILLGVSMPLIFLNNFMPFTLLRGVLHLT